MVVHFSLNDPLQIQPSSRVSEAKLKTALDNGMLTAIIKTE